LERGNRLGTVESVKAVEEIYAPLSGKVLAVNQAVIDQPELLQQDPYGAGWLLELSATEPQQFDDLLDAASYSAKLAGAA
jgi:glycine cleavage system H protein